MGWLTSIVAVVMTVLKSIFGMDKPQKTTITHAEKDIEVDDGKTKKERLKDAGL